MKNPTNPLRWVLKAGSILDEPADVLICSANPHLTLSGGVGADLLARYGTSMQEALSKIVTARDPHYLRQGEIAVYEGKEIPYRAILHAVAIDGWYESSPKVIETVVRKSFAMAAGFGARRVTLTALATGFGHLSLAEFAAGLSPLMNEAFPPMEEVCLCLMEDYRVSELANHLPGAISL